MKEIIKSYAVDFETAILTRQEDKRPGQAPEGYDKRLTILVAGGEGFEAQSVSFWNRRQVEVLKQACDELLAGPEVTF